jgi:glycosyltransferase involved in cell wall biosynthesis
MYGCYAADIDSFNCVKPLSKRGQNFFFIGRLRKSKGIDLLINAYQLYRDTVKQPWGLMVAGTGGMTSAVEGIAGIKYLGFIPPNRLPINMEMVRCLILPSRFEPWGVVIHEASAAGLPIIASYTCGATTAFVRDGVNGYIISPTVEKLTHAMCHISELGDEELTAMGDASSRLASLWSPNMLARYFCSTVRRRCRGRIFCAGGKA